MRALIPLSVIAANLSAGMKKRDSTLAYKFTWLRHLAAVYKEFHLYVDHDFQVKTVILDQSHVINMPCDFVYETKVGLLKDGRCAILTLDRNMMPAQYSQTELLSYLDSVWTGDTYVTGQCYPFYNCDIADLVGYGCHTSNQGIYNINKKNGTIEIGSLIPEDAKIVIEYKSDGVSDGLKLVPAEMEDVLSYGAKERFYEEIENYNAAKWNGDKHKEKWGMVKRLYNFRSALYTAQVAYNHTSEI